MSFTNATEALRARIRLVPDFPEAGVLFQDLTPVLADPDAFHIVIDELAEACRNFGADMIGGLDARGFLLGSAVAYRLNLGILAIRKKGKLPPPVYREDYLLEYGTAALEIPKNGGIDLTGKRIVLVDDVLATGGTLLAAKHLLENHCGARVTGNAVVLEVVGLGGRDRLGSVPVAVVNSRPFGPADIPADRAAHADV